MHCSTSLVTLLCLCAGVRRVEAVAGPAAVDYFNSLDSAVKAIGQQLKVKLEDLPARVSGIYKNLFVLQATVIGITVLLMAYAAAVLPALLCCVALQHSSSAWFRFC